MAALAPQANAQERFLTPTLSQAIRSNWVRFDLVAGQIILAGNQIGNINSSSSGIGQSEALSLQFENGHPSLSYSRTIKNDKFSIRASGGNQLQIVRSAPDQPNVEFIQKPGQPTRLVIGQQDARKEYEGETLWHLLLAYPELCKKHLIPALDALRPEWKLSSLVAAVEKDLLRHTGGTENLRRQQWAQNVRDLGSDRYSQREAADRSLRASGSAVLSYLEQLDPKLLDAEQQFRIRRIVDKLSLAVEGGSAEQISAWLGGDPSIWLVLLDRPDASTRALAAKRLADITPTPIVFDAAASDDVRKRQIEKIRHILEAGASRGRMNDAATQRAETP